MFDLCESTAVARTNKRASKQFAVKVNEDELKEIEKMIHYYGCKYSANLLRLGLEKLYNEMLKEKK